MWGTGWVHISYLLSSSSTSLSVQRTVCVCVCVSLHRHLNGDGFGSYGETEAELASKLNVVSPIMIWLLTHFVPSRQPSQGTVILLRGFLWSPRSTPVFASQLKEWFLGEAK